jgi:3-methyladenine DNA glycosylase/8-oxoguanine DNA glycosylase
MYISILAGKQIERDLGELVVPDFDCPRTNRRPILRRASALLRVCGIGPWTTETVMGYGAGDVDATITADLHLPQLVC